MSEQTAQHAPNAPTQTHGPTLQRACACGQHTGGGECEACKKKQGQLQRAALSPAAPQVAPPIVHDVLHTSGQPLNAGARAALEPRFGQDFSRVRVHTDAQAAASARAVGGRAYTVGQHIAFGTGQYAPTTRAGQQLLAHELTHTIQQGNSGPTSGALPIGAANDHWEAEAAQMALAPATATTGAAAQVQCQDDRAALRARLQQVQNRLAQLRNQRSQLDDQFTNSTADERQRASIAQETQRIHAQARSDTADRALWGGRIAGNRIRRVVTASQSGNTVTLSFNLQLTYLTLSDTAARKRAETDIPRIESAIRAVWQVTITSGEYAGITLHAAPTVTYLPRGDARSDNAFLIQVRGQDTDPSSGTSVTGIISLAQNHLEGSRVIVVAHELAHLFGFMDTYFSMTTSGPGGKSREQWNVARGDAANRPDLLGMIDPVFLARLQRKGAVTARDVARQTGPVRVWEEEASTVLGTLGIAPPAPQPPTPDSEDFDPSVELDRTRREGEARLAPIRERRQRAENSLQWLTIVEEIMRLESEERSLTARLSSAP